MGFASADAASAEVTGGAGGRVPVGFGPQRRSDNAPGKQRERGGVTRVPVMFGLAEAARMEVTAACAGGIRFCGCNQRRGDGRCWRPRAGGIWSTEARR